MLNPRCLGGLAGPNEGEFWICLSARFVYVGGYTQFSRNTRIASNLLGLLQDFLTCIHRRDDCFHAAVRRPTETNPEGVQADAHVVIEAFGKNEYVMRVCWIIDCDCRAGAAPEGFAGNDNPADGERCRGVVSGDREYV